MKTLNSPILSIALLALVLWLGYASGHQDQGSFISQQLQQYDSNKSLTYAQTKARRQAKALKSLYELTDDDATREVKLW